MANIRKRSTRVRKKKGLDIQLMGYFHVLRDGYQVPEDAWRSQNTKGLLAYLALNHSAWRQVLMKTFWPDRDFQPARANLCSTVRYVRQALRSQREPDGCVIYRGGMYCFEPRSGYILDADRFEECLVQMRLSSDDTKMMTLCQRAVELYRGELMEGLDYKWALPLRERMRRLYVEACLVLANKYFGQGAYHQCLAQCERVLHLEPASENARHLVIRSYLVLGQREAAVRHCQELKRVFAESLKAPLSSESRALCQTLLSWPQ